MITRRMLTLTATAGLFAAADGEPWSIRQMLSLKN